MMRNDYLEVEELKTSRKVEDNKVNDKHINEGGNYINVNEKINIFIKSADDKTIVLQISLNEKAGEIKAQMLEKTDTPTTNIRLEFGGKVLKDDVTLMEYNVNENSTIFAFYTMVGGMKSPMKNKKEGSGMEIEKSSIKNPKEKLSKPLNENAHKTGGLSSFSYDSFRENSQV